MEPTIGEKIKAFREDLDMNQTELGKMVNMTQRKISYIECGKYEPSIEDIKALCNFFNVRYVICSPFFFPIGVVNAVFHKIQPFVK